MQNKLKMHRRIKKCLGSKLSLESYLNLKDKIEDIYQENAEDVFSIPSDICDLGVANGCALRGYVDFHTKSHVEQSSKELPKIAGRLRNIF